MTYLDKLNENYAQHFAVLQKLKLVAFDVDGVLTNGQLHYSEHGETHKVFHVRDGVGLKLLVDVGVNVAVITAKDSPMVAKRMNDLGIKHYFPGSKNKLDTITALSQSLSIELAECAFVGDDMVDLKPMSAVGFSFSPNDAYEMTQEQADIVLPLNGGEGVARLVADIILASKNQLLSAYQLTTQAEFERSRK